MILNQGLNLAASFDLPKECSVSAVVCGFLKSSTAGSTFHVSLFEAIRKGKAPLKGILHSGKPLKLAHDVQVHDPKLFITLEAEKDISLKM